MRKSEEKPNKRKTVNQSADYLAVQPDKICKWIAEGLIEAADMSSGTGAKPRWRIEQRELDRFWSSRLSKGKTKPTVAGAVVDSRNVGVVEQII